MLFLSNAVRQHRLPADQRRPQQVKRKRTTAKKKKMFRTITSLIFGGKKETCEEVQPGEVLEEDWLLVSHQGMFSRLRNPSYVHY